MYGKIPRRFQDEINLLKIRANRLNHKCKLIDEEMNTLLESLFKHDDLRNLKSLWKEETTAEEYKSSQRWESKQQWLDKYAEEFDYIELIKPKQ